jgi:hypothetical protein
MPQVRQLAGGPAGVVEDSHERRPSLAQPQLLFTRTRIPFHLIVDDIDTQHEMVNDDTVVAPYREGLKLFNEILDPLDLPEWVDYCEILEVDPEMVGAPPIQLIYEDEDPDIAELWGHETEPRPSAMMQTFMSREGTIAIPTLGRRLLLVSYDPDADEWETQRLKRRVKRTLHSPVSVWQGRLFEGYCFIDHRPPTRIIEELNDFMDCDEIEDYLLVQPTRMARPDKSGLSPLGDWIDRGYKQHLPRATSKRSRDGAPA